MSKPHRISYKDRKKKVSRVVDFACSLREWIVLLESGDIVSSLAPRSFLDLNWLQNPRPVRVFANGAVLSFIDSVGEIYHSKGSSFHPWKGMEGEHAISVSQKYIVTNRRIVETPIDFKKSWGQFQRQDNVQFENISVNLEGKVWRRDRPLLTFEK